MTVIPYPGRLLAPYVTALTEAGADPAIALPLARALRTLAATVPEDTWDAEIRRRVVALIVWRGETFLSLAQRAGWTHSYYAKKLGSVASKRFPVRDFVQVLGLLDATPDLLLDPQPVATNIRGAKGRRAPPRADVTDEVIEPYRHLLGTMADQALADQIGIDGVDKARVLRARRRYGIPGISIIAHSPLPRHVRPAFEDPVMAPHRHLLGTMPDRLLAEQLGVAKGRVFRARKRYGIPGTFTREK